jgi:hypothetical protein
MTADTQGEEADAAERKEAGSGTADWPDGLRGFGRAQGAEKA